jgi:two-component system NtrC family sensor kinase
MDAMEKTGGKIDIKSEFRDHYVLITLADTGPGIPSANLSRIFDPFFTTKPVGKGTGLGLSICYGIVKKMGGEIDVYSEIDRGTVFSIRIPATGEGGNDRRGEKTEQNGGEDRERGLAAQSDAN